MHKKPNDRVPAVTPRVTPENVGRLSGGEVNNGADGAGKPRK